MRVRLTMLGAIVATLAIALPAAAVTSGSPDAEDGDTYDAVGNLLFYVPDAVDDRFSDPGSWFTCSGTQISDDVVVTAGHCTYAIGVDGESPTEVDGATLLAGGTDVWITFEADANEAYAGISSGPFVEIDDNQARYDAWSSYLDDSPLWVEATSYTHPLYDDDLFFLYDLGVLVLEEDSGVASSEYGTLPEEGALDELQTKRRNDQLFTAVGYGIQQIVPTFEAVDVRYEGTVRLLTTKGAHGINGIMPGTSVVFSNNNGKAARGGICFGDSGGPVFFGSDSADDGGTIAAVTSYGVSPNCTGTGGGYRIDKAADLAFIETFVDGGVWPY